MKLRATIGLLLLLLAFSRTGQASPSREECRNAPCCPAEKLSAATPADCCATLSCALPAVRVEAVKGAVVSPTNVAVATTAQQPQLVKAHRPLLPAVSVPTRLAILCILRI